MKTKTNLLIATIPAALMMFASTAQAESSIWVDRDEAIAIIKGGCNSLQGR